MTREGLLCYKRAPEINKSFLILNKAKSFCVFMDLEFVLVHKNTRKRTQPIFSHLDLMLGQRNTHTHTHTRTHTHTYVCIQLLSQ